MTDPVEQSRRWAAGLDASREQYDRRDFTVGRDGCIQENPGDYEA